jgi:hypothetical protein
MGLNMVALISYAMAYVNEKQGKDNPGKHRQQIQNVRKHNKRRKAGK